MSARISGLHTSDGGDEVVRRDSLPHMNHEEHEQFKTWLNKTTETLGTLLVHMTDVHQGFLEEQDVPTREAIKTLTGDLGMLKHYRMRSRETGFAAGEVSFLDILNDIQDYAGHVTDHFEDVTCKAEFNVKLSVHDFMANLTKLVKFSSEESKSRKLFLDFQPMPHSPVRSAIPTSARSPFSRLRTTPTRRAPMSSIPEEGKRFFLDILPPIIQLCKF
jgi:hypothetical protein